MTDPNLIFPGKDPDFVFPEEGSDAPAPKEALEPWKLQGDWPQEAVYNFAINLCIEVAKQVENDCWPDRVESGAIPAALRKLKK